MIDQAYLALKGKYQLGEFTVSDVSKAFTGSECITLRDSAYLGRLVGGLGMLSAMVRDYKDLDAEDYASEYVSRDLSDLNHLAGKGRYTIFGTELKADRRTYKDYVSSQLISDALRRRVGDFFVINDNRRIDGVSGLKRITLYEMRHACNIAGADLRNMDLIIISSTNEAIESIEINLRERLLS